MMQDHQEAAQFGTKQGGCNRKICEFPVHQFPIVDWVSRMSVTDDQTVKKSFLNGTNFFQLQNLKRTFPSYLNDF